MKALKRELILACYKEQQETSTGRSERVKRGKKK
jgi:hypothetical protein